MQIKKLLVLPLFVLSHAIAQTPSTMELWNSLKEDFESKPYFYNAHINDFRDRVMSPYILQLYNGYKYNNAEPLSSTQLNRLPDAYFLDPEVLHLALKGREKLLKAKKIKDIPIMAIVDFAATSRTRRLFVIDIKKKEVLINNWVSHARNSDVDGDGYPETFSNKPGSEMSPVGFMFTSSTYQGTWGYSLRLNGLDAQLNSNVLSRAVVIHPDGSIGAQSASWQNTSTSQGCFMVSMGESGRFWGLKDEPMSKIIVDTLKNGALFFVYTDVEDKVGGKLIYKSDWIDESSLNDLTPARVREEIEPLSPTPIRPIPVDIRVEPPKPVEIPPLPPIKIEPEDEEEQPQAPIEEVKPEEPKPENQGGIVVTYEEPKKEESKNDTHTDLMDWFQIIVDDNDN